MATVTVRNLPDEVHRALRIRAAQHSRSTEAEIRDILESAVRPTQRLRLGTALADLGRQLELSDDDLKTIDEVCSHTPAEPQRLE